MAQSVDDLRCNHARKEMNENKIFLNNKGDDITSFSIDIDGAPSVDELDGFITNLIVIM